MVGRFVRWAVVSALIAIAAWALLVAARPVLLFMTEDRALGEVTAIDQQVDNGSEVSIIRARFRTETGDLAVVSGPPVSPFFAPEVGDDVTVVYPSGRPEAAEVLLWWTLLFPLAASLVATGAAIIAARTWKPERGWPRTSGSALARAWLDETGPEPDQPSSGRAKTNDTL
jgi:hypothetical protein